MSKHYKYARASRFTGKYIYNPYASVKSYWWKSNFHAHSIAWRFTNGHQLPKDIISHFKKDLKYDIACISNYEKRTPYLPVTDRKYIPVYEHGYNVGKVHQLVFGTQPVDYYDIPFFQSLDNKQYVIDRLKNSSTVVAIAHPGLRDAYSKEELEKLSGYDLMEVLNREKCATLQWDEALSASKPVWIIADDDCHDISKQDETGVSWTMVNADTNDAADVFNALKTGKTYGVMSANGVNNYHLKTVKTSGDTITIVVDSIAERFRFIGQNGVTKKIIYNTNSVSYIFQPADTYIRTEIDFPTMKMYLNPLIRYNGKRNPDNPLTATIAPFETFLYQALIAFIWSTVVVLLYFPKLLKGHVRNKIGYKRFEPGLA